MKKKDSNFGSCVMKHEVSTWSCWVAVHCDFQIYRCVSSLKMWSQLTVLVLFVVSFSIVPVAAIPRSPKYGAQQKYPDLLHTTIEELSDGLAKGLFTSVDLVKVGDLILAFRCPIVIEVSRPTLLGSRK